MKLAQLKTLVKRGESELLEFKESTGSIKSGMQTVCAFLNSCHGGTVLFGVKNNGKIVGQEISDATLKLISDEFYKIEPQLKMLPHRIKIKDNLYVIALLIDSGIKAPYAYDGRSYVRSQSTTRRMSKEEYVYLYNKNNQTLWESLTNNSCTIADLDKNKIKMVVEMGISQGRLPEEAANSSTSDVLQKLGLVVEGRLTNAAVVLFCKNEEKQFEQSSLKLARFRGIDKDEFIDNKPPYKANAFDLYDKAMDYLRFHLPISAKIVDGQSQRIETPAIPYIVLREAITNALIHRDYSHPGGSLFIARYDDRVNISNIGSLPAGVSITKLSSEHLSIKRNPLIAKVFYICGKIENWGRGTTNMIKVCKESGVPIPIYEEIGDAFSVTIPLKEPTPSIIYEKLKK